jgi:hypothetical protein
VKLRIVFEIIGYVTNRSKNISTGNTNPNPENRLFSTFFHTVMSDYLQKRQEEISPPVVRCWTIEVD